MSDFTKGNWGIKNNGIYIFISSNQREDNICTVGWCRNEENKANARLIVAAPEMYNLLRDVAAGENSDVLIDTAKRLLKRIDGE